MAMRRLLQEINEIFIIIMSFLALMVSTETSSSINKMPLICTNSSSIMLDNNNIADITTIIKNFTDHNNCPNLSLKIPKQLLQQKSFYCLPLDYILCLQHYFKSYSNINAIIEQGNHTPGSTKEGKLHIARHDSISLIGNSTKENVILTRISVVLSEVNETYLSNFTAERSSFNVYGTNNPHSRRSIIIVTNCTIINSNIILTDVVLSIRNCEIKGCQNSAILSYSSFIVLGGVVEFSNNTGETGGALDLRGSRIRVKENADITFQNNYASIFGGAIFVDNAEFYVSSEGYDSFCFYSIERVESKYSLNFVENFAEKGGNHIYGASLNSSCTVAFRSDNCGGISETNCSWTSHDIWTHGGFRLDISQSLSPISSNPTRVCLCNENYQPSCVHLNQIFHELSVYPGEYFTIPMVTIGGDFGTTIGTVYAHFDGFEQCIQSHVDSHSMRQQVITQNKKCTNLTYCFYGNKNISTLTMYLSTNNVLPKQQPNLTTQIEEAIENYYTNGNINQTLLNTPIILNITFLQCPPGFLLLENPLQCDCHPHLINESFRCILKNRRGYISWNSTRWINTNNGNKIITNSRCPFSYCKNEKKDIDLQSNSDAQCAFNRAGKLCGECRDNYSLAIGSSHCIHCPNNNNLALLIFFAAVGPLLALIVSVFNLTVTQGIVNGLFFYANIVWAYQSVFFPPSTETSYVLRFMLKPFIAWLNLDFGIETCFYKGLDMFSKTWLQFIFPVYTAALFFIGLKFSSKLSKLFGDRSVPTLATLLALSLNKLLRTIIAGLQLAEIETYTSKMRSTPESLVWALDGNLEYGKSPHVLLLFVVLVCLVFLWIPYTLILFSMQWLRKIDHYRPLKMIAKYKPVYDAYFAPFKDKHHYWIGVLLLAQGALLLVSSLFLNISLEFALYILLLMVLLLLCYLNFMRVYRKNAITILESSFYVNLILLTTGMLYLQEEAKKRLIISSIGIAFIKFWAIVIWNLISWKLKKCCTKAERGLQLFRMESVDKIKDESDDYSNEYYRRYRDSVLN